jgi:hypothetical protein
MTSRIKLKLGDLELEYEGEAKTLTSELPKLLKVLSEIQAKNPTEHRAPHSRGKLGQLSVTTVAQKLNAHKLPDLILAGAFTLTQRGSGTFEKRELRKEIRGATGFYKDAMRTNFEKALTRLAKTGRITHSGGENYALPPSEHESIAGRLG